MKSITVTYTIYKKKKIIRVLVKTFTNNKESLKYLSKLNQAFQKLDHTHTFKLQINENKQFDNTTNNNDNLKPLHYSETLF